MQINKKYWLVASDPASEGTMTQCPECNDLWKECDDALVEYLRILAERDAARKRQDHDLVEAFEEMESESLEKCYNAQQAIFDHAVSSVLAERNIPRPLNALAAAAI
jgi:predicted metal-binding protein